MTTKEEAAVPDAAVIQAWAKGVRKRVAEADTKIARAQARIDSATADLTAAQTERVGLNEDAVLLGLPNYEPDDTPKAQAPGAAGKYTDDDIVSKLEAHEGWATRDDIATALGVTGRGRLDGLTKRLQGMLKAENPRVGHNGKERSASRWQTPDAAAKLLEDERARG